MTIGERIRNRRTSLKMSADELAEILGKNRATIYRYESNDIENLPASVIVPLASALRCSPAFLMGWTDTDGQTGNTPQEEALLSNYRQLNPDGQKKVDDYVGDLVKGGLYPAEEGEEYIIAARTFGKDKSNAIKKIRLKKRKGAGSLIDVPDYKV